MAFSEDLFNFVLEHIRKLLFPEEWIRLDLSLSKTELFTLFYVEKHGEVTMSQIADLVGSPLSTATGIVNRLVKQGFLVRERSEADRRIVIVKITAKAAEWLTDAKESILSVLRTLDESLSAEEKTTLFKIVQKVLIALERTAESGAEVGEREAPMLEKIHID